MENASLVQVQASTGVLASLPTNLDMSGIPQHVRDAVLSGSASQLVRK